MRADRSRDRGESQRRHWQGEPARLIALQERSHREADGRLNLSRPRIVTQHRTLLGFCATPQFAFAEVPGDNANRCSLFELQQWHCRWPIGDPTVKSFGFCGNTPINGLPYCAAHARMAYRPRAREAGSKGIRIDSN